MKSHSPPLSICKRAVLAILLTTMAAPAAPVSLFDGESLKGWESSHAERWRIENGAIVSGDFKEKGSSKSVSETHARS